MPSDTKPLDRLDRTGRDPSDLGEVVEPGGVPGQGQMRRRGIARGRAGFEVRDHGGRS
ncbi:hypothetical protein ACIQWZ_16905 [Streptomyces sp. NPDC098077]|uniref:hypothetical protein n=1 Tax=Streptomyces sp. NPDC098077 TaxID=3366093 RepID=UPI003816EAEC